MVSQIGSGDREVNLETLKGDGSSWGRRRHNGVRRAEVRNTRAKLLVVVEEGDGSGVSAAGVASCNEVEGVLKLGGTGADVRKEAYFAVGRDCIRAGGKESTRTIVRDGVPEAQRLFGVDEVEAGDAEAGKKVKVGVGRICLKLNECYAWTIRVWNVDALIENVEALNIGQEGEDKNDAAGDSHQ